MDTVKTLTLIETTLARRGDGKNSDSPVRVITQYWTPDGQLVFEIDPAAVMFSPEKYCKLRYAIASHLGEIEKTNDLMGVIETAML